MDDNFDLFDNENNEGNGSEDSRAARVTQSGNEQPINPDAALNAEYAGPAGQGQGHGHKRASRPANRWLRGLAGLCGLLSVAAGLVGVVHAVAPASLPSVPRSLPVPLAIGLAVIAFVLVIIARVGLPKGVSRRGVGTIAVVTGVLGLMLAGGDLLVTNMVPEGIIKAPVRDDAPTTSTTQMEHDLEQAAGPCSSGWRELGAGSYPGVSQAAACIDTRVAFVTFDSKAAASMERSAAQSMIAQQLRKRANDAQAQGDWYTLNGPLWMAVGQKNDMTTLHKTWGGTLEALGSATEQ
jgi:disulfide bond formation protein DsbB